MQIQINTDKNISANEGRVQDIEETLTHVLARFEERITRIEVHLSDENSTAKSGVIDKRCLLEVRLAGRDPRSVSDMALTVEQAVSGAAHKMVNMLERDLGKLGKR